MHVAHFVTTSPDDECVVLLWYPVTPFVTDELAAETRAGDTDCVVFPLWQTFIGGAGRRPTSVP